MHMSNSQNKTDSSHPLHITAIIRNEQEMVLFYVFFRTMTLLLTESVCLLYN